ncbi:aminoacyl-tRNA hydrolase [Anaerostipes sp. 494a]|uniref:aminoacyl-tRNA hydrolase n=1 Tax=Anaerostipes TaxID=207244 RepID=UPI0009532E43|nr:MULTISPECIES: aminoacyl-tRNA hydrolase [Anaerostipes]MCI5623445.1 aminoacyl-tRNA hydrolase [Anaerostipes sp.]MDY2726859.1 aminoacyl-tRNA hydrolase [Anaerostipes faecalis]OLR59340.1 aminoacyl-tRNA hydrolase [Anaerostipes sp. 494a]
MKVIVGLGNPGKKYENTRHNIGFAALDYIADKEGININTGKHKALVGSGYMGGEKVLLVKPQTFMNLSGESLRPIMDFYKLDPEDFLVIFDDIDLDVGRLRIRKKGSAGGHNGIKSIISHLGSMEFPRVKIGVGAKPKGYDLADYVLGHFGKEDQAILSERFEDVYDAVKLIVEDNITEAMNRHNKKK